MNQSYIDQAQTLGGTTGITGGSVYFRNGVPVITPYNGNVLAPGASTTITFTGHKSGTNWTPSISSVDGIAGSTAPLPSDGIDHIARAAATGALSLMVLQENSRAALSNSIYDFLLLDSHIYKVATDGSQIIFDSAAPGYSQISPDAMSALAAAQTDPSVASYLVTGLLSCFGDSDGHQVYGFNAAGLRGWSYTKTAQNMSINALGVNWQTNGTDNINRVGAFLNNAEQVTLTQTVNANSEDDLFGMLAMIEYSKFEAQGTGMWNKYSHLAQFPCSPFNGPGASTNPHLMISVNGRTYKSRDQIMSTQCPYSNKCSSIAVIDPVAYASAGQLYDTNSNLVGPSNDPFQLDPNVLTGYNPDHKGQWARDPAGNWGQFSVPWFSNGRYWYKWNECPSGVFKASGC
jgi:hypothetical protein